jgi:outer membrane protein TolC
VMVAAKRRQDSATASLTDTQARVQAQLSSSNDATRVQIDVASATRELEVDRGNLENSYIELAYLMNAPVPRELQTPDNLLVAAKRTLPKLDQLVKIAIANRPDLASKRHLAAAAHKGAEEPLLRLVPTLGVGGQVQVTSNPAVPGRWNDESAALTLTWTIYDAGVRYADKHSRDANAEIADLNVRALVRGVDSQVRSAVVSLQSAQATLAAAEQTTTAAQQSAEETEILYRQGLAKAIELVDANDQRFLADVQKVSAQYQVGLAYLALRQALGLEPSGPEIR